MSTIKVDNLLNSTGDQDSGIDLSTNDQIILKTANTTAVTINSSQAITFAGTPTFTSKIATSNLGTGAIIQVKQTTKTDTFTTTSTSYTDVTGLSVSITPSSSSNKILFMANLSVGGGNGTDVNHSFVRMMRDSTAINIGDARGSNRHRGTSVVNTQGAGVMLHPNSCFLDSPSTTSAITYKIQMLTTVGSQTATLNRSGRDSDDSAGYDGNASSTITVMEVVG